MRIIIKSLLFFTLFALILIACEKENQPPTCEIVSPENGADFEIGEMITISVEAEDTDGKIEEIRFYIDDIGVSSSTSFPYNYQWNTSDEEDGIHKIKVSAKDDKGTVVEDEFSILLKPGGNPPVAAFTVDKTSITEGESIQFTDQSTNDPTTWSWDFGEGSTSTSQNPSHSYSSAGTYNVSLIATNSYGSDTEIKINYVTAATSSGETGILIDYDGNTYNTIKIGTQWWMAENLKTTHYADGSALTLIENNSDWVSNSYDLTLLRYSYYNNDTNSVYNILYTWYSAVNGNIGSDSYPSNLRGVCPSGWHLPSKAEWQEMIDYVSMVGFSGVEGVSLKSSSGWIDNGNGTDDFGFSALPGGWRDDGNGRFSFAGEQGYWWSSDDRSFGGGSLSLESSSVSAELVDMMKEAGSSVRCVKD